MFFVLHNFFGHVIIIFGIMISSGDIIEWFHNKNFLMFFVSLVFMSGIMACFSHYAILISFIFSLLVILLTAFGIIDVKKLLLFIFIFYSGFFLTFFKIKDSDDLLYMAPYNSFVTGRIISVPNSPSENKSKFFFDVYKIGDKNVKGKTLVTVSAPKHEIEKLNIGDLVVLNGNLRRPPASVNPSQFDYSAYLKNFNAFTVFYSNDTDFIILNEDKRAIKWKFLSKLNAQRNKIIKIHSKYLRTPNLEILGGIVFGDDAVAPPEYIKNSFVNSGLLHILAASGLNVGFIFAFWYFIMRRLRVPFKFSVLSGIFVICLYTLMTGLGPSVIRASLMLSFVLLGKLIDRDAHSISLLSLIAMLMLVYNPAYINDVSFQLSFMVTFGLLTTANVAAQKIDFMPNWLKGLILIPLVAQIWVAPIQMFYFNTFSLYSVLANICCVHIVSVISFLGFISSILALINPISDVVCAVFDFITKYFIDLLVVISDFFSNLPHCIIQTTHPSIVQIILYYIMLLCVTNLIKNNKYKKALATALILSCVVIFLNIRFVSSNLEIIAFDVQNADSFLVKTPQQKYFFIDTGKSAYKSANPQAKIIMLKYLKDRGIKDIEGVIVTHFDSDHSGGASSIISSTNVKTLYLNGEEDESQTSKDIFSTISKIKQNTHIVKNNEIVYSEPNFKITNYKVNFSEKRGDNDNSIVTLISYGDFNMLFMGDAGIAAFNRLKKYLPQNVEVLKVGHHGAYGVVDDSMIKYLNSKVSVISTGKNQYGHPAKTTLNVLRNTDIYRTDLYNSIKISSDGKNYEVHSYNSKNRKYELREKYKAEK